MHFLSFYTAKTIDVTYGSCKITLRPDVTSRKPCNNTSCRVLCNVTSGKPCNIIQLLTIEALDMMWYRPESTNIDQGGAEVNIGILRSISHHVQCLNSQQLFYYIISLSKKKQQQQQQNLDYGLCLGQSSISFFYMMTNWFHSVKRGMNAYFICNYNYRQRRSRWNAA